MPASTRRRNSRAGMIRRRPSWLAAMAAMATMAIAAALLSATGCAGGAGEAPREDIPLIEAETAVASGVRAHGRHEFHIAITWFEKAIARYRSIDDASGVVVASLDLADTLLLIGEHQRAQRHLAEAELLVAESALEGFDAHLALLVAYARVQNGDDAGAMTALGPVLVGVGGERTKVDLAARMLAADIAVRGDPAEARARLARLQAEIVVSEDSIVLGRYRRLQADLDRRMGRLQAAESRYRQALNEYRRAYYRPGIAATHERLAHLHIEQQQWQPAAAHLERALHIRLWVTDRVHSLQDMQQLARMEELLGNSERARELADWQRFLGGDNDIPWQMLREGVGGA